MQRFQCIIYRARYYTLLSSEKQLCNADYALAVNLP